MAAKLISIVSNTRKMSEEAATSVAKLLKAKHKKVAVIRIASNTAPDSTVSPYIASMYDVHSRHSHQDKVAEKLIKNDYVIVLGYSAETIIRESTKLNNKKEINDYNNWLQETEQKSYKISSADYSILLSDNIEDSLHSLATIDKRYYLLETKDSAKKILKLIEKPIHNINSKNKLEFQNIKKSNLLDVINTVATGKKIKYTMSGAPTNDPALDELISSNKLIAKRLGKDNEYIIGITTPLGSLVSVECSLPDILQHKNNVLNIINSLQPDNFIEQRKKISIKTSPANEIELSNNIAYNYGLEDTSKLSYTERMRIIETWTMNLGTSDNLLNNSWVKITTKLCLFDYLLLSKYLTSILASWQPLSPANGYIDCTAPISVENIVQDIFDTSTILSASNQNKQNFEKYLLLGHTTVFILTMNWFDLLSIKKRKNLKGSELLTATINEVSNYFEEKFPIMQEFLKSANM